MAAGIWTSAELKSFMWTVRKLYAIRAFSGAENEAFTETTQELGLSSPFLLGNIELVVIVLVKGPSLNDVHVR